MRAARRDDSVVKSNGPFVLPLNARLQRQSAAFFFTPIAGDPNIAMSGAIAPAAAMATLFSTEGAEAAHQTCVCGDLQGASTHHGTPESQGLPPPPPARLKATPAT